MINDHADKEIARFKSDLMNIQQDKLIKEILGREDITKNGRKVMLFAGCEFYPSGGWDDFQGFFSTVEEAKQHVTLNFTDVYEFCWAQVIQLEVGAKTIIHEGYRRDESQPEWEWEVKSER